MIDRMVVDASIAVAWIHPAQATEKTVQILESVCEGASVEVPALWPLEVSNALLVLVRRKKLREAERQAALAAIQKLAIKLDYEMSFLAFNKLADIAAKYQLSVYDAAYFELAQRKRLPLACKDGALKGAAVHAKIKVL